MQGGREAGRQAGREGGREGGSRRRRKGGRQHGRQGGREGVGDMSGRTCIAINRIALRARLRNTVHTARARRCLLLLLLLLLRHRGGVQLRGVGLRLLGLELPVLLHLLLKCLHPEHLHVLHVLLPRPL
jgi:hypothetical protein